MDVHSLQACRHRLAAFLIGVFYSLFRVFLFNDRIRRLLRTMRFLRMAEAVSRSGRSFIFAEKWGIGTGCRSEKEGDENGNGNEEKSEPGAGGNSAVRREREAG